MTQEQPAANAEPPDLPAEMAERINAMPPDMRNRMMERMASMDGDQRARMMERMRGMFESMTPEQREQMERVRREMQAREAVAPKVGDAAPDFDLAVLGSDGERVRLADLRGRPVGLIFGSYT